MSAPAKKTPHAAQPTAYTMDNVAATGTPSRFATCCAYELLPPGPALHESSTTASPFQLLVRIRAARSWARTSLEAPGSSLEFKSQRSRGHR